MYVRAQNVCVRACVCVCVCVCCEYMCLCVCLHEVGNKHSLGGSGDIMVVKVNLD